MVYLSKERRASIFKRYGMTYDLLIPIVVEGKRDTIALRRLGIEGI